MSFIGWRIVAASLVIGSALSACGSSAPAKATASGPDQTTGAPRSAAVTSADASTAGTTGAGGKKPAVDPCTLLSSDDITAVFKAVDQQYAAEKFHNTSSAAPGRNSPDAVACEFQWNVLDDAGGPVAGGTFIVEVSPAGLFDSLLAGETTEPVAAIPGAKRFSGARYAKAAGYTVDVQNINTDAIADGLLKIVIGNLH